MHFYNPHSSDFLGIPLSFTIIRKKPLLKYAYLLKASKNAKYIFDFKESSIFKKKIIKKYFYFFIPIIFLEIILWCSYNEISFRKVKFILKEQKKNFKLFIMSYKSMTDVDNSTFEFFNSYSHIYIHLTHYFIRTKEKAKNISKIKAQITLLGDSDFKNNSYFKKYFKKKNLPRASSRENFHPIHIMQCYVHGIPRKKWGFQKTTMFLKKIKILNLLFIFF